MFLLILSHSGPHTPFVLLLSDQPLWCYTLDHFNITPLVLPGNGKALFEKNIKRMRKGGHRYKSEASVSSNQTKGGETSHEPISSCWLEASTTNVVKSRKLRVIPNTTVGDPSYSLSLNCPDEYRKNMAPSIRTKSGITIGIPYYASPATLLQQLDNFVRYPKELQHRMTIIIVDDGSPIGLQVVIPTTN